MLSLQTKLSRVRLLRNDLCGSTSLLQQLRAFVARGLEVIEFPANGWFDNDSKHPVHPESGLPMTSDIWQSTKTVIRPDENRKMPRKIRELIKDLTRAGFAEVSGGGKGSHRKFVHERYPGIVTLSGQSGDDAKPYQETQVRDAILKVQDEGQ